MIRTFSTTLKALAALLGLWLIIGSTAVTDDGAIWIAFGTAIALAVVATADFMLEVIQKRWLASTLAFAAILFAGFLIAASLDFRSASLNWLMPIAGGIFELWGFAAMIVPRLQVRLIRVPEPGERGPSHPQSLAT